VGANEGCKTYEKRAAVFTDDNSTTAAECASEACVMNEMKRCSRPVNEVVGGCGSEM
jgi:hypothetical protein